MGTAYFLFLSWNFIKLHQVSSLTKGSVSSCIEFWLCTSWKICVNHHLHSFKEKKSKFHFISQQISCWNCSQCYILFVFRRQVINLLFLTNLKTYKRIDLKIWHLMIYVTSEYCALANLGVSIMLIYLTPLQYASR